MQQYAKHFYKNQLRLFLLFLFPLCALLFLYSSFTSHLTCFIIVKFVPRLKRSMTLSNHCLFIDSFSFFRVLIPQLIPLMVVLMPLFFNFNVERLFSRVFNFYRVGDVLYMERIELMVSK